MRILRSGVIGLLLLLGLNQAHALVTRVTNFSQLVQAVEGGEDVRAIIHFDNCLVKDPALRTQTTRRLDGATTRFNFDHYFHAKETINNQLLDTVTTSMKMFIERPSEEVLTLSGRLSVFEDNTATLHVDLFDPVLKKQTLTIDWFCTISNGQDDNGLMLFSLS